MRRLCSFLSRLLGVALAGLLALLVLVAGAETLAWTFFELSSPAAAEVSGLLLVWLVLLSAAYGVGERLHLAVEALARRLPPRLHAALGRLAAALVALFGLLLAVFAARLAAGVTNTLPATGLRASVQYLPAIAGGALIALFALAELLDPTPEPTSTQALEPSIPEAVEPSIPEAADG